MRKAENRHIVQAWSYGTTIFESYRYAPGPASESIRHSHEKYQFCLSLGVYSGFTEASNQQGGPPPPPDGGQYGGQYGSPPPPPEEGGTEAGNVGAEPTDDTTFLRGVQLADASGVAEFDNVYPGWYQGRALHMHLKVIVDDRVSGNTYEGGQVSHTGQLFFPEDVTDQRVTLEPYSSHGDVLPIVPQSEDGIFESSGGDSAIVELTPKKEGAIADGFVAEIVLGVDPNATPDPAGMDPEGGSPPGN